jgi:PAS domain S-box-containing protein
MQGAVTSHSRWRQWIWSVGFALALAAVSLLLVQAYRTARRADALREFLTHTSRVLSGVQQLETLAARMEADQRGFLIAGTGNLERARESEYAEIRRVLADLLTLARLDAAQSRRVIAAGEALRLRHERMLFTSGIAKTQGTAAARAIFNPFAERGFEPVRRTLADLRRAEQQRLAEFTAAAGSSARRVNDIIAWGSLLALALLLACCYVLWRQMRQGEALRRALAHSNAMQRAVLESAGLMVIAVDPIGTITLFNHAARAALGYEPEELVGRSDPGIFHLEAEVRTRAEALSAELGTPVEPGFEAFVAKARRGITDVGRWTYVRRDGSTFRVQLAVSAVRGADGTLLGFVGIAQDVTDVELAHEQLLLSEQRVRTIIETASDAFIAIDTRGRIEEWNAQAERMLGWRREEVLGQLLADVVIPQRYREAHQTGLERYLATGQGPVLNRRIEITALDRNEREFPIELTIWPTHTATRVSFNAFLQDITERKVAQDSIRKLNAELTLQARQLADTNRELESFSYSVSHDLRAPLRHMSGYAQILREEAGDRLDRPLLRYLDEISASARRMGALIDDLLAFSRLSRQALTPIPIDMNAVVADAMRDAGMGQNPEVRVDIARLPDAHGDPVLLRQVWTNLLSNAVKYSAPRGAQARIQVEGERDDDKVRYRVRDNGVGFDPRYADKLFGVFQRLHAQDEFEGTGVGLAIVHRIVARHRGQVSAHSEPGQGAEFVFELPTTLPEEASA